jgi:transcriptional regulator with XRE-family HTH domain
MTTEIDNQITDQASRLKKIRLYLGMTREVFGKQLHISQYTIRSWETGAKNFSEPSVKRVVDSLNKRLNFYCTFDWLMYGSGESPITLYEEKDKNVDGAVKLDILQEKILKEVMNFKSLNKDASVIIVSDDRFYPLARPGDYIGLIQIDPNEMNKHIGSIIFFINENEVNFFGCLSKKKNQYYIKPFSGDGAFELLVTDKNQLFLLVWFRKLM